MRKILIVLSKMSTFCYKLGKVNNQSIHVPIDSSNFIVPSFRPILFVRNDTKDLK